jgi:tRNA U34 5-methylaminomethyl-2-thiouridine-forming methyltransferase MnmC
MPIPVRQQFSTIDPSLRIEVTDDGSRTLVRDEVRFHSGCGAAAECDYVYLRNAGMGKEVDQAWPQRILEIGFGTGMAMLRSVDQAMSAEQPLHFIALENLPIPTNVLRDLGLEQGIQNLDLVPRFLDQWDRCLQSPDGPETFRFAVDSMRQVEVRFVDAVEWICRAQSSDEFVADAIYFDPFDPQVSPELWHPEIFDGLWRRLKPGGRLVTYCVRGDIRKMLARSGFDPRRVPGPPGGKREVLIAIKPIVDPENSLGAACKSSEP